MKNVEEKKDIQEEKKVKSNDFKELILHGDTFTSLKAYQFAYKMAVNFQQASMIPKRYQGNVGDCIIAIDMASRLKANPLMVMQNLYVVNGMPAWSGQFVIAAINTSGRFSEPLRFKVSGSGDSLSCYAYTKTREGELVRSTTITMDMAKKEGWFGKSGSKWQTMPEQMIQYRAASFFGRLYCSDLLMGIYTTEEAQEINNAQYTIVDDPKPTPEQTEKEINTNANKTILSIDQETGEILEENVEKEDQVIQSTAESGKDQVFSKEEMEAVFAREFEEMIPGF